MRGLKICLWIAGLACIGSIFGMFLPVSHLESIASLFGEQPFPDSPLFHYMLRLISATYVAVGVFFVYLAMNPMKYGVLVPFSGMASLFVGIVTALTGSAVKMPVLWFLGASLGCIIIGALILIFWKKIRQSS